MPPLGLRARVGHVADEEASAVERVRHRSERAEARREIAVVRLDEIAQQEEIEVCADAGPVAAAEPQAADEVELGGKLRAEHRALKAVERRIEVAVQIQISGRPQMLI